MVGFHRPVYTVQTGVVRAPRVGDWDEGKIRGGGEMGRQASFNFIVIKSTKEKSRENNKQTNNF